MEELDGNLPVNTTDLTALITAITALIGAVITLITMIVHIKNHQPIPGDKPAEKVNGKGIIKPRATP